MRKYVTIPDIRQYPSYRSTNARLLYMHVAMGMEISTRTYAHSLRQLSAELGLPFQQIRTALKQLENDGLVATQSLTQVVTYGLTRKVTHNVTQIYVMSASELEEASNAASNTASNTATNTATNTPTNTDINNINIPNSGKLSHSDARARLPKIREWLLGSLGLEASEADELSKAFLDRQELKGKTWDNEGDLLAHAISWAEKRMKPKKVPKMSDSQAREAEYRRTAEVAAQQSPQEKELELVRYAWNSYCDKRKRLGEEFAASAKEYYIARRREYESKYGEIKAS
jgi:hypothetical protein